MFAWPSAKSILTTSGSSVRTSWRDLLDRLGGPYAFSPLMVLLSSPLMIVGLIGTEYQGGGRVEVGAIALIGVAGQLVLWLCFWLASRLDRGDGNTSPWFYLVVYLIAGQVRVVTLVAGFELFAVPHTTPLWQRVLTSALLIPLVFGFSSYSWAALMKYMALRAELIEQIAQSEIDLGQRRGIIASMRESFLKTVDVQVDQANAKTLESLSELEKQVEQGAVPAPELARLIEEADSRWRGISHRTFENARITLPRVRIGEFLDTMVASRPLSGWTIFFGSVFVFALTFSRILPLLEAVVWGVLWLAVYFPLTRLLNIVGSRIPRGRSWVFVLGVLTLILSGLWTFMIPGLEGVAHWAPFVIHVTVLISSVVIGMGPAVSSNNQRVIDALKRHLDQGTIDALRVESELVVLARKVASRLHAENRGEFMARILRLQQCLDRGEKDDALAEIRAIREALHTQRESDDDILDDDLMRFLNNWRGLVDINSNLHTAIVPDHLHPAINTVVMDAVNDAIRHGNADWIEVHLETGKEEVVLTVSNNGAHPGEQSSLGMGAATLDRLAMGGWSRVVDVLGFTRLTARFPLA
jgi:hypothetical protein